MAYNYEYPYTDPNRYNSDWLLNRVKELSLEWIETRKEWNNTQEEFASLKAFIQNYFAQLDLQDEVNVKLDIMARDGSLSALISPLFSEYKKEIDHSMSEQNDKINVLNSRMDTFTSLPDGSTAGDAELQDIRIGYNGKVYLSAGDAVRMQVSGLKEDLTQLSGEIDNLSDAMPKKELLNPLTNESSFEGVKAYFNSTYNLIALSNATNYFVKTFAVEKNKKYKIVSTIGTYFGDNEESPFACVGGTLIGNQSESTPLKQPVLCEALSSTQEVSIYFTSNYDGYLYVNCVINYDITVSEVTTEYEPVSSLSKSKDGLLVKNGTYTHFVLSHDDIYICRVFKHAFINNLLQLHKMYTAKIIDGNLIKVADIGVSNSDVVGPVSISRGDIDSWIGKWSGGSHGVSINGVEYPTAKQKTIEIFVDGKKVNENGMFYGDVTIITENEIFYPQTISGNDLSTASLAFIEKRIYSLTDKMNVKVYLTCGETVGYITAYYGCQCNTYDMSKVYLPNNEIIKSLRPAESETYYFDKKENKYFCCNENAHYDVTLHNVGLGTFSHNEGTTDLNYGNVAPFQKVYYQLIHKATIIENGKVYMWEADYDYYFD